MSKVKSKAIVGKRFKLTKNGKVLHRRQGIRHLRRKKSKSRQRRQDKLAQVAKIKYVRVIRQFLEV